MEKEGIQFHKSLIGIYEGRVEITSSIFIQHLELALHRAENIPQFQFEIVDKKFLFSAKSLRVERKEINSLLGDSVQDAVNLFIQKVLKGEVLWTIDPYVHSLYFYPMFFVFKDDQLHIGVGHIQTISSLALNKRR